MRCHQQGKVEDALELYKRAVQADPKLCGAWRNLGALLRQRGQLSRGAQMYRTGAQSG